MRDRLSNISLRQLRVLEEVARLQSFVGAATSLHLTPSALSESVRTLEASLGLRLFDRTTRSVRPTAAGQEFIENVRVALGQLDRAVEALDELQNLKRGLVRCIGAASALACLVAPCLTRLWKRAPELQMEMRTNVALEVLNILRSGEADFCIGSLPDDLVDEIEFRPLIHDCLGLVAERNHPAVQAQVADLRLIRQVPYVTVTTLTMTDKLLAQQEGIAAEFLHPAVRVDSNGSLAAVLQQGVAVSILPALTIHHLALNDLKFCPLIQSFPERTVGMSRLRGRSLTPAAQALWDLVQIHSRSLRGVPGIRIAD